MKTNELVSTKLEDPKSSATAINKPTSVIIPSVGWVSLKLGDLWAYRELLYFLTWRDIKVRYKQTVIGAGWAILQPFLTMIVFSLFFGNLAKIPSDGIPYPIFSYAGLVPWTFFAYGIQQTSNSVVGSSNLIKKIYFPRLVIPISSVLSGVVDFLLAFSVLLIMMLYFKITPTVNVIWLPLLTLLALVTALGVGLWLSALNVQFRDIRYIVPFLTQFWMFITPIAYPSSLIKNDTLRLLYSLNPMTGVVEGFRWALLNTDTAPGSIVIVSSLVALGLLVSGAYYYRRMEKHFAGGFCLMFRREAIEGIWFDEHLYTYSAEDSDFSIRVAEKWRLLLCGDLHIEHHPSKQSRSSATTRMFESGFGQGYRCGKWYSDWHDGLLIVQYLVGTLIVDLLFALARPSKEHFAQAGARARGMIEGWKMSTTLRKTLGRGF